MPPRNHTATRPLGSTGLDVFPISLGCMGMSGMYSPADDAESVATIHTAARGVRPAQLAIAWVLAKSPRIIPVIGARTRKQLAESLGALEVRLSPAEIAALEETVPASAVAGTRYDERQMRNLDSERG
jgi:aryl-alcohol dehydrogenase-like predicted oxidoreductase